MMAEGIDVGKNLQQIMGHMVKGYRKINTPVVKHFKINERGQGEDRKQTLYYVNVRGNRVPFQKQHVRKMREYLQDCKGDGFITTDDCKRDKQKLSNIVGEYESLWSTLSVNHDFEQDVSIHAPIHTSPSDSALEVEKLKKELKKLKDENGKELAYLHGEVDQLEQLQEELTK